MIWASVDGLIPQLPVPLMCFFMWMAAHAQTFFDTSNVVNGVHNFGDYGGTIVGIMKGFLGLSGAMLIQFYETVCLGNPKSFILLVALTPTLLPLLLMNLVRNYDTNTKEDKKHLNVFSAVALIIAAYLTINILLENIFTLPLWSRIITFVVLVFLVGSPLRIAVRAQRESFDRFAQSLLEERGYKPKPEESSKFSAAEDPTDYRALPSGEAEAKAATDYQSSSDEYDLNLLQALRTVNFWLLLLQFVD